MILRLVAVRYPYLMGNGMMERRREGDEYDISPKSDDQEWTSSDMVDFG